MRFLSVSVCIRVSVHLYSRGLPLLLPSSLSTVMCFYVNRHCLNSPIAMWPYVVSFARLIAQNNLDMV